MVSQAMRLRSKGSAVCVATAAPLFLSCALPGLPRSAPTPMSVRRAALAEPAREAIASTMRATATRAGPVWPFPARLATSSARAFRATTPGTSARTSTTSTAPLPTASASASRGLRASAVSSSTRESVTPRRATRLPLRSTAEALRSRARRGPHRRRATGSRSIGDNTTSPPSFRATLTLPQKSRLAHTGPKFGSSFARITLVAHLHRDST